MDVNIEKVGERFVMTVDMDLTEVAGMYGLFNQIGPVVIHEHIGQGNAWRIFGTLQTVREMHHD